MNTNTINYDDLDILLKKAKNIVDRGKINLVEVNGCKLICYENDDIYRNFRGNGVSPVSDSRVHVSSVCLCKENRSAN